MCILMQSALLTHTTCLHQIKFKKISCRVSTCAQIMCICMEAEISLVMASHSTKISSDKSNLSMWQQLPQCTALHLQSSGSSVEDTNTAKTRLYLCSLYDINPVVTPYVDGNTLSFHQKTKEKLTRVKIHILIFVFCQWCCGKIKTVNLVTTKVKACSHYKLRSPVSKTSQQLAD